MEVWKSVPSLSGDYDVSNLGRVRSRIRRGSKNETDPINPVCSGPYRQIAVPNRTHQGSRQGRRRVSALVAEAFIGLRPEGAVVNHLDGNKHNDAAENLEYTTQKGNCAHARDTGLAKPPPVLFGADHGMARITTEVATEIILRLARGDRECDVHRSMGVTRDTVAQIKRGKTWAHLSRT